MTGVIIIMQDLGAFSACLNFLVSNQLFSSKSCRGKELENLIIENCEIHVKVDVFNNLFTTRNTQ